MIHIDKELTHKLAREHKHKMRNKVKEIVNNIFKEVERIYSQPSLNQRVKFRLIATKFLKNKNGKITVTEDASVYLKSYCDWQGQRKRWYKKWFYSVLLTGWDLYYMRDGRAVRSSTGNLPICI